MAPDRTSRRFPMWLILLGAVVHAGLGLALTLGHYTFTQLIDIGTVVFAIGVTAGAVFFIAYSILARWYRSAIGVMFWLLGLASIVTGVVVMLSLVLGQEYPGREWVRLAGYLVRTDSLIVLLLVYLVERRDPASLLPRITLPRTGPLPVQPPAAQPPDTQRSTI